MIKETIFKKSINFDNDLNKFDEKLSLNLKEKNILVIGGVKKDSKGILFTHSNMIK